MKEKLDKLLDQWIITEEEHKKGMEADRLEWKDLDSYKYDG